jgi:hypothetical protein
VTNAWRHLSRLTASGPTDWLPLERLEIVHRDGSARVVAEAWPASGASLRAVADRHGDLMAEGAADWEDRGLVEDGDVLRRDAGWKAPDGTRLHASISYRPVPGGLCVITAWAPTDGTLLDEASEISASIRPLTVLPAGELSTPHTSSPPSDAWRSIRTSWHEDRSIDSVLGTPSRITLEEAVSATKHHGSRAFPGIDARAMAEVDASAPALRVAARTLALRLTDDHLLDRRLSVALRHDLLIVVDTVSAGRRSRSWYVVRPDAGVQVRIDQTAGAVELYEISVPELSGWLLQGVPIAEHTGGPVPVRWAQIIAAAGGEGADLLETSAPVSITRVRTVYRTGSTIAGGELLWMNGTDAGPWRVDGTGDLAVAADLTLVPVSRKALHVALVDLLPGNGANHDHRETS